MPTFKRGDLELHYEIAGEGPPLLLLAPGGMRSASAFWQRAPYHPVTEFQDAFRVISMDQRNAGGSHAAVRASDGWQTYSEDQLALLDELQIERCHVLGGCIGGAFALSLIARAPERVRAAVLQQPIGLSASNRPVFYELFDGWAAELRVQRGDVSPPALAAFRERMYGGDFVFSVSRQMVANCPVPLLVLRGNDVYHPREISEEIVRLAPHAELIAEWRAGEDLHRAVVRIRAFLNEH